jgi:hypothetical protein
MTGKRSLAPLPPDELTKAERTEHLTYLARLCKRPRIAECTCPHGVRPLGKLHGIQMGQGIVRLDTDPACQEHGR